MSEQRSKKTGRTASEAAARMREFCACDMPAAIGDEPCDQCGLPVWGAA